MLTLRDAMHALLTVPLQKKSILTLNKTISSLPDEVEAVEVWIDQLQKKEQNPEKIQKAVKEWKKSKKKIVIVCKDALEKGSFTGTIQEKIDLLLAASKGGADYIDIGFHCGKANIRKLVIQNKKAKVIVSHHDFDTVETPKKLQQRVMHMKSCGADVIKIAETVSSPLENERLLQLALDLKKAKVRHIIIGMGEWGVCSRIFAKKIGNELNFVATKKGNTAAGQLSLEQMNSFQKLFT